MVRQIWIFSAALAFAVAVPVETLAMDGVVWQGNSGKDKDKDKGQGKGKGQDKDKDHGQPSARGVGKSDGKAFEKAVRKEAKDDDKNERKNDRGYDNDGWSATRFRRYENAYRLLPVDFRRIGDSGRQNDLFVLNAAAWGVSRGMNVNQIRVNTVNNRVVLTNNQGVVLVDLTEDRARSLGAWEMRRLGDRVPKEDGPGPAFCRSGAGHPTWGREWCLEKGHGLGNAGNVLWSRAEVDDIRYLRPAPAKLDNRSLLEVLGDVVLGRLALQAVSMGYAEPLVGTWVAEPNAPRLLRVQSGSNDVAELVDRNGDNRVDVLYVTQWR